MTEHKLVTIATFEFPSEAQVMKLLLEDLGIDVFLADDNLVNMNWFLSGAVGAAKLQVLEPDAEVAARFVEENREEARQRSQATDLPEITFDCQECGQEMTFSGNRCGGVETCPHCHEFVDVPELESHQSTTFTESHPETPLLDPENPYAAPSNSDPLRQSFQKSPWVRRLMIAGIWSLCITFGTSAITSKPPNRWIVESLSVGFLVISIGCFVGATRLFSRGRPDD